MEVTTTSDSSVIHLRPRQRKDAEQVLLRPAEAARRLGVSPRTVERWIQRGRVPHVCLGDDGTLPRIPVDLLDEWWKKRLEGGR